MGVRLRVEIGPTAADLDQVLEVDLDDLIAAVGHPEMGPQEWTWTLPGGAAMRLTARSDDTPSRAGTPTD